MARSHQIALVATGVGGEPRRQHHAFLVEVEVHCGVVHTRRLMDVKVYSVVGFQLQRRLHAGVGEHCRRHIVAELHGRHFLAHLRQAAYGVVVFLSVVVARNPIGSVVARHGKFRALFLYCEIGEIVLRRPLIAESYTIVVESETHNHLAQMPVVVGLRQAYSHFVVVVSDARLLAPYRLPRLVERRAADAFHLEPVEQ